ncbi:J domain-containing protein [Candidatus Uhrbacteria bacterium]|nr:J domain-containing protein [Candidatus Uhrbacteria bacterium]
MTLYELLCVPTDASRAEIRRAFRARAQDAHPDRFAHLTESQAEQAQREHAFQELLDAYTTLMDKRARARYDRLIQIPQGLLGLVQTPQGRRAVARLVPRAPLQARDGEDHVVLIRAPAELLLNGGLCQMTDVLPPELDPLLVPSGARHTPWAKIEELGEPGENEGNRGDLFLFFFPTPS